MTKHKCNLCGKPVTRSGKGKGIGGRDGYCADCGMVRAEMARLVSDRTKIVSCGRCGYVFDHDPYMPKGHLDCKGCRYDHVDMTELVVKEAKAKGRPKLWDFIGRP